MAAAIALKKSPFLKVNSSELAQQLTGLQKAKEKLPLWFNTPKIYYPPKLNLEQTSSEVTAKYKASLVSGDKLIDLTGGFGIDSFYFAKKFKKVVHCELNPELSKIAAHNLKQLGCENIDFTIGDSIEYLKHTDKRFDCIYIDPARRDFTGARIFQLEDYLPNVPDNLALLTSKSDLILIKTSPLLDLQAGIKALKHVSEIHIIAVKNEVKELLWLLDKSEKDQVKIKTLNFKKNETERFNGSLNLNLQADVQYALPQNYLFEPNAAIMKSGLFDDLASKTKTSKLHPNSHLYTSYEIKNFPGRRFKIKEIQNYKASVLKKMFKGSKANITTRNFPDTVAQLRKKLRIKDGGDTYLFFTTNAKEEKIVINCEKL
ncbi:RNA cap guanine-N2 methyltransferase [Salegentibacter echinorum]|uniref:RNA cap guanine-N2 methyltransferase n=1 Tax=Salegentibacter echinorum TaxID=1073325 RepID=A0A1M5J0X9_SALEC|nr:class I SAM-dependent methyltransferase [Salegentibacter echinorum]SHG34216.1 RNA cap guanine-N2 methyltransferase [Salegentibacter echinorum]